MLTQIHHTVNCGDTPRRCRFRSLLLPSEKNCTFADVESGHRLEATNHKSMAKVLGTFVTRLKGSVGNVTYRTRAGQTIASEKVSKVKNPNTLEQATQRCKFATVLQAYKQMREICDHSFEGYTTGAECQARFMKLNMQAVNGFEFLGLKGATSMMFNPYQISEGSLPALPISAERGVLTLNFPYTDLESMKVSGFLSIMGINAGDQLTFIRVKQTEEVVQEYGTAEQLATEIELARIIFDPAKVEQPMLSGGKVKPEVLTPESMNTNLVTFGGDSTTTITIGTAVAGFSTGVIRTSWDNGKRRYTTCKLSSSQTEGDIPLETAINSYRPNPEQYLNNNQKIEFDITV